MTPGIMVADMWEKKKTVRNKLFKQGDNKGEEVRVQYIDLAEVHEFSELGQRYMESMSATDQLELFDLDITKKIILFQWPIIKRAIVANLFVPFVFFLSAMVCFTTFLLHGKVNAEHRHWIENMIVEEILVVFSLYFLGLEMMQMKSDGIAYL